MFGPFNQPVHDGAAYQSQTEERWTGVLEHFDPSVVNHQQDCHHAGDRAEQRYSQQHQSEKYKYFFQYFSPPSLFF